MINMHCLDHLIKKLVFLILIFSQLSLANNDMRFRRLSIEHGLSQTTVETIIQDQSGFMWFGTEDGLNRYDGYQFKIFKHDPDDSTSISNNNVWCLYEDHDGYLWAGTFSGGLNRFDPETETFKRFLHNPGDSSGLSSNNIRTISEDHQGYLWIGTRNGGINSYNLKSQQFERRINDPDVINILNDANIRFIYPDSIYNLWIATNKGLYIYNLASKEFTQFKYGKNIANRLSSQNIRHVFEDRDGMFWISTFDGLNSFDPRTKKITQYIPDTKNPKSISSGNIRQVYEDTKGRMWILGHLHGIMIMNRSNDSFNTQTHDELNPNSLSSNSLREVCEDRSGLIWIGALGGGLNIFDPGTDRFRQYRSKPDDINSLSHSIIWSITESSNGDIWFATHSGGLSQYDKKSKKYTHYKFNAADPYSISSNNLRSVMEDRNGNIWVGTQNAGINRFDQNDKKFYRYKHEAQDLASLSSNNVRDIYEDHYGNLWICTWAGGLDLYDSKSNTFTHFVNQPDNPNSLSGNNVISIYQDSDENYWVATTNGLNKLSFSSSTKLREVSNLSGPDFTRYLYSSANPNSLSNNYVLSIHESENGDLWFGTMLGLNRLEKKHRDQQVFKRYLIKDGLPNDIIYGILEDSEGHIWCSTNKGLSHFNLQNKTFKNYDMRDGLHGNEFNTGAYLKTKTGSMIFGGVDGATEFFPDSLYDSRYSAPIVLTGFYIFDQAADLNKSINQVEQITLSYQDNYFSFDFASLDFSKPERNRYAYMLEGLDRDWINSGTRRFAGYTKVDAGEYIFKVKGTNGDGVWNEDGASIRILITPPFWETWWFIALVIIGTISAITLLVTYRVRQLLAIERLRSKIAADLHDDIGAGLTEISIMGEVIIQKLPGQSNHVVSKELESIGNTARNLIDSMSNIVWLVNPKRDSLYELISRLSDTYKDLLEAKDIQFMAQNLDSLKKVRLKMEHRQHLFMLFHEAINNSVKYSEGNQISLSSSLKGRRLQIKLEDNGQGFDVAATTNGNGLKNMKERAKRIKGELYIESRPGKGTSIEFEGRIS
jgi:ligand-binding sensor domain-containing protein/two-component sensor histidine kinase